MYEVWWLKPDFLDTLIHLQQFKKRGVGGDGRNWEPTKSTSTAFIQSEEVLRFQDCSIILLPRLKVFSAGDAKTSAETATTHLVTNFFIFIHPPIISLSGVHNHMASSNTILTRKSCLD